MKEIRAEITAQVNHIPLDLRNLILICFILSYVKAGTIWFFELLKVVYGYGYQNYNIRRVLFSMLLQYDYTDKTVIHLIPFL